MNWIAKVFNGSEIRKISKELSIFAPQITDN